MSLINKDLPLNPIFDDFFSTPALLSGFAATPFLSDISRDPDMILRRSSPCYEVTENDEQYQLDIDVPGVAAGDITAQVENDGRVLHISGGRKVSKTEADGSVVTSESRFQKRFVLDQYIDADKITANLQNGVLKITAPKDVRRAKTKKIAITDVHPAEAKKPKKR